MSQTIATMISNDEAHFFEGVEKLMEVWFTRKDAVTSNCDLRKIPRSCIEEIMMIVKCEIISTVSTDQLDAYVLSESSMFISSRRFILKTCGTTTPLACINILLELAYQYGGYDEVQDLYYSRKNFKRPELQQTPHRTFEDEAAILDSMFTGGRAYCMGSVNRADCWYLYTMSSRRSRHIIPRESRNTINRAMRNRRTDADQTLEILMTDLDAEKMKVFYKSTCPNAAEATKKSGIDKFIPGLVIDAFQFDPCGYSMNGVMRSMPGGYMTIHITPEPQFSYVSFETNIGQKNYRDLIRRVVSTFMPKQFVLTFFSNVETGGSLGLDDEDCSVPQYGGYSSDDIQMCRLPGYDLTYALYNRFPS